MKTIGLIGGMSWQSTTHYYQLLNQVVADRLGGLHSAQVVVYSLDFAPIERCQTSGDWDQAGDILAEAARALERVGADYLAICANTMHKVADQVQAAVSIPLIHLASATAEVLNAAGVTTVGLLGTRYTMEQDFYQSVIRQAGIDVIVPPPADIEATNTIIFDQLCLGILTDESRQQYLRVIDDLAGRGAQGVILGCTEIGLLIKPSDTAVRLFDTTEIHVNRLAELSLADEATPPAAGSADRGRPATD